MGPDGQDPLGEGLEPVPAPFDQPLDLRDQGLRGDGLGQEVVDFASESIDGYVHAGISGHEGGGQPGDATPGLLDQIESRHSRQSDISQEDVDRIVGGQ